MFRWLNKQGVESIKGFALQRMDRFHYRYSEGPKVMRVDVEPMTTEVIDAGSLKKWLPPFEVEPISDADIVRIERNIDEALDFMGIGHRIE